MDKKKRDNQFPNAIKHLKYTAYHSNNALGNTKEALFHTFKSIKILGEVIYKSIVNSQNKEKIYHDYGLSDSAKELMDGILHMTGRVNSDTTGNGMKRENGAIQDIIYAFLNLLSTTYYSVYSVADGLDTKIGNTIVDYTNETNRKINDENKKNIDNINYQQKKEIKDGRLKRMLRNNMVKIMMILSMFTTGGAEINSLLNSNDMENVELIDNHDKLTNKINTETLFKKNHISFWDDNPDYFEKDLGSKLKVENIAKGVKIIRDAGMVFYVLQEEDLRHIESWIEFNRYLCNKLSVIPEFAYLKNIPDNKVKGFNVPANIIESKRKYIEDGKFFIPVPLDEKNREISVEDFANYSYEAIDEMSQGPYATEMEKLLKLYNYDKKRMVVDVLTFFRNETSNEYTDFTEPLGAVELHRREDRYKAFSYGYGHFLMEKNGDGVSSGPGLSARKKLGLTEGQVYHPINSTKMFWAYRFEKAGKKIGNYLPLRESNIGKTATYYNGGLKGYAEKTQANWEYLTKKIGSANGDSAERDIVSK